MLDIKRLLNVFRSNSQLIERMKVADNGQALALLHELKERLCLQDGTFNQLDLSQVNWHRATFANAEMVGINLQSAILSECYAYHAHLHQAQLNHAILHDANLREVRLTQANLSHCVAHRANFARATLTGTLFHHAQLTDANFWRADVRGVDFMDATLKRANLTGVVCDEQTRLPDGVYWTPQTDWRFYTD